MRNAKASQSNLVKRKIVRFQDFENLNIIPVWQVYNNIGNRAIQVDTLRQLELAWKQRFYNPRRKHSERNGIVRKAAHRIRDEWRAERAASLSLVSRTSKFERELE